jgi:hypothetical protein
MGMLLAQSAGFYPSYNDVVTGKMAWLSAGSDPNKVQTTFRS